MPVTSSGGGAGRAAAVGPAPAGRGGRRRRSARVLPVLGGAALALALAAALTGCSSSGGSGGGAGDGRPHLSVRDAYVPEPVSDSMAAGFLTVRNTGAAADKLTSVDSDISDDVQMHRTVDQKMERVRSLPVPADGRLELAHGGNHLMLLDLDRKPAEGDTVRLTLHFEKSADIKVEVPVKAATYMPGMRDHDGE